MRSFSSAARELDVDRQTIADLAKVLGIVPKPIPFSVRAKGLDDADFARIKARLTPEAPAGKQRRKAALAG